MNDPELAVRLKKGDQKALETIIMKYTALVSTIIYNVSKENMTREDIEEVTSDVFITLWNNRDKILPEKLKGYICCIAKTRALNKLESVMRKGNVISIDDYDFEDDFSIEYHTESKDVNSELRKIVNDIGEPDREILIRYYFYYQKTSSIAEIMKLNLETVKSKLKRTREKIKKILTERGYEL